MKRSIFFMVLFITTLAAGCNELEREVEESWSEDQPKLVVYYRTSGEEKVKVKEEKFYKNGQMEYTGHFNEEGERHGNWKYWYPNGNLWSEGEFENGKRHGKAEVYYENGQLRYKGRFEDDKEAGHWVFHRQDGTVYNEIDYDTYQKATPPQQRTDK